MWTELPIEPAADSPVFRASLTALDVKACAIRKTCKNALQAAQSVHDLLEKLELAESDLYDSLDLLRRQIVQVDAKGALTGLDQTATADGVVRDLKAWKINDRTGERQRLDVLVTSRVRALKAEMKAKGVGAGGTLSAFEVRLFPIPGAVGSYYIRTIPKPTTKDRESSLRPETQPVTRTTRQRSVKRQRRPILIFDGIPFTRNSCLQLPHTVSHASTWRPVLVYGWQAYCQRARQMYRPPRTHRPG